MRAIIVLSLIMIIFLAACAPPPSIAEPDKPKAEIVDKDVEEKDDKDEETKDTEDEESEDTEDKEAKNETIEITDDEARKTDIANIGSDDFIDVKIGSTTSAVKAEILDIPYDFSIKFTDKDAIIFEVSKEVKKPLNYVRLIISFGGKPFLRPSEKEAAKDDIKEALPDGDVNTSDFGYATYIVEKEDGIVRKIGCNLENKVIRLELFNDGIDPIPLYRPVIPRVRNALVIYLNSKMIKKLYCDGAEEIPPGESITCVQWDLFFINEGSQGLLSDGEFDESLEDSLVVSRPGYHETIKFKCTEV